VGEGAPEYFRKSLPTNSKEFFGECYRLWPAILKSLNNLSCRSRTVVSLISTGNIA